MTRIGGIMTTAVTVPVVAGFAFMVNAASDYKESLDKVDVVFMEQAAAVVEWSKTSAKALGISQQAALEAASTYGNLFITLGLGKKPAADMSMNLVQLASDLASMNNIKDPQDVLLALRSGLSGEVEPLKRFAIAMNETTLAQTAQSLGFKQNFKDLTEAQKLQVRYALIMDQTTISQGNFALTSDQLAGSLRSAKAEFQDAAMQLGTILLPYALKAVGIFRDLVAKFNELSPTVKKGILIFLAIVAAIGPLLLIIGSLITAVTAIAGAFAALSWPVIGVILLIIAAVYLLYQAWINNFMGIQQVVKKVVAWLLDMFFRLRAVVLNVLPKAIEFLKKKWGELVVAMAPVVNFIKGVILPELMSLGRLVGTLLKTDFLVFTTIWKVLLVALRPVGEFLVRWILPALKTLFQLVAISLYYGLINLGKAFDWLNKQLIKFNGYLAVLKLPKWLTPGSPTPLELGLKGIDGAMRQLNNHSLPDFNAGVALNPVTSPKFATTQAVSTRTIDLTVNAEDMTMRKVLELIENKNEEMVQSLIEAIT